MVISHILIQIWVLRIDRTIYANMTFALYHLIFQYFLLLYAGAHLGAYNCMGIYFWCSGVYHMEQRDHAVFFRIA